MMILTRQSRSSSNIARFLAAGLAISSLLHVCQARARSPLVFRSQQQWWGLRLRGGSQVSQNVPSSAKITSPNIPQQPNPQESERQASRPTSDSDVSSSNSNVTTQADTFSNTNNSATAPIPEWKQRLPVPLCHKKPKTLQRISIPYQNQMAEIYILGTAHVSNDSSRDVKLLLKSLQPDVIFVELCDQRTSLMEDPPEVLTRDKQLDCNTTRPFWDKVKDVQVQTNNSKFQSIATVLLTQTQEEYADSLGVELGGEFRAAYQYWRSFSIGGAAASSAGSTVAGTTSGGGGSTTTSSHHQKRPHLILGDRPLAITLARCWESLSWFGKIKVIIGLVLSSFRKPKPEELREWIQKILEDDETDLLKASLEDLRKHFPTLERVIIQERDAYMACKLYQLSRGMLVSAARSNSIDGGDDSLPPDHNNNNPPQNQNRQQHSSAMQVAGHDNQKPIVICALVGAGHVPGICAWLTNKSHPQGPEALLANLIETKKFKHEDLSQLIYDVTELQDLPESSATS